MRVIAEIYEAQGETPVSVNGGRMTEVQTIEAFNLSETAGAFVKLYQSESAPNGSADPIWRGWVPAGASGSGGYARTLPVFATHANLWIAVATEAGAGLTAPDEDFEISMTRSIAGGPGSGGG